MRSGGGGHAIARRLIRAVRPSARRDLERLARWLVARRGTRRCLNVAYNRLPPSLHASFYALFAKMFRAQPTRPIARGEWRVDVGGRWAALPLGGADTWLEWDLAVSMLGHEPEIKRTYLELLRRRPPRLFLDVGANYGLHSLFLLLHGIPTVSFEPNAQCHDYFRDLAARNHVPCDLRPVALGAVEGWTDLSFPEGETWLGSSNPGVRHRLATHPARITTIRVAQTTLDAFVRADGRRPDLIKIDTEGNEAAVIQGARETLRTCRPAVIFESWPDSARSALFAFLEQIGYRIRPLPLRWPLPDVVAAPVLESPATNFIALPIDSTSGE